MSDLVRVVPGFSPLNRLLLYISMMLSPAQFAAGLGANCPSNIGFLAYNWYTQIQWYHAARSNQLHALSLLMSQFNFCYTLTYLGGVSSGNMVSAVIVGFGTAGVMVLNNAVAWVSWSTAQVQGYGVYEFWFVGWRTLSPHWHRWFLLIQLVDTLSLLGSVVFAVTIAFRTAAATKDKALVWWYRYQMVFAGGVGVLLSIWPIILWTELIIARNHIMSDTDGTAVWLFVVQVVAMLAPPCFGCCARREKVRSPSKTVVDRATEFTTLVESYQDALPEEQQAPADVPAVAEP
ncbi:hypothetical protein LTR84_005587 [Exophiala bonariae]|uniref:Uncharacterized protein n=1 Tax=Exophiala bonariae TaxID=1690606 RepID=A0AAV9N2S0_9EURO|nr:hypothetical protein LTR84_005587 [Exophiala bonariae]